MRSKASIYGHPIHPMLIVAPLGLLPASVLTDLVFLASGDGSWGRFSFWLILGGIVGGVLAGVFGAIDWSTLPKGSRARHIGTAHAITNLLVLAVFAWSWGLRLPDASHPPILATTVSIIGVLLGGLGGWLGGELVFRHRVGVDETDRPA